MCQIFACQFFACKIFMLKYFVGHGNPRKLNSRNVCCRQIFVRLIFVVRLAHKNVFNNDHFPNYSRMRCVYICIYLMFALLEIFAANCILHFVLKGEVCEFNVCGLLAQYCQVLQVKILSRKKSLRISFKHRKLQN